MNRKKILITGINGYIGTNLANYIKKEFPAASIEGIDLNERGNQGNIHVIDLLDRVSVLKIIKKIQPDHVFHLAGIIYSRGWKEFYKGNVETTINLFEAVKESGKPARVVVPGSAAEYGLVPKNKLPISEEYRTNPVKAYGVSKVWQTAVTQHFTSLGANAVVGRIFNIIGRGLPDNSSIGSFATQINLIKQGKLPPRIVVGNITTKRDFLDIHDVCSALVNVALFGHKGEIYNIASGRSISMKKILSFMCKEAGVNVDIVVDPLRMSHGDIRDIFGSNSKLIDECNWQMKIPVQLSIKELFE